MGRPPTPGAPSDMGQHPFGYVPRTMAIQSFSGTQANPYLGVPATLGDSTTQLGYGGDTWAVDSSAVDYNHGRRQVVSVPMSVSPGPANLPDQLPLLEFRVENKSDPIDEQSLEMLQEEAALYPLIKSNHGSVNPVVKHKQIEGDPSTDKKAWWPLAEFMLDNGILPPSRNEAGRGYEVDVMPIIRGTHYSIGWRNGEPFLATPKSKDVRGKWLNQYFLYRELYANHINAMIDQLRPFFNQPINLGSNKSGGGGVAVASGEKFAQCRQTISVITSACWALEDGAFREEFEKLAQKEKMLWSLRRQDTVKNSLQTKADRLAAGPTDGSTDLLSRLGIYQPTSGFNCFQIEQVPYDTHVPNFSAMFEQKLAGEADDRVVYPGPAPGSHPGTLGAISVRSAHMASQVSYGPPSAHETVTAGGVYVCFTGSSTAEYVDTSAPYLPAVCSTSSTSTASPTGSYWPTYEPVVTAPQMTTFDIVPNYLFEPITDTYGLMPSSAGVSADMFYTLGNPSYT